MWSLEPEKCPRILYAAIFRSCTQTTNSIFRKSLTRVFAAKSSVQGSKSKGATTLFVQLTSSSGSSGQPRNRVRYQALVHATRANSTTGSEKNIEAAAGFSMKPLAVEFVMKEGMQKLILRVQAFMFCLYVGATHTIVIRGKCRVSRMPLH